MGQRVLSGLLGEGCWPCRCPPPWLLGPPLLVLVLFPCQRQWKLFVAEACCFRCCRGFAPSGANYPWGSQPIYQPGTWIMGVPWFKTALVVGSSLSSGGTDVFTCMPGERYRSRPMSLLLCLCYVRSLLLCLCYGFQGLINSLCFDSSWAVLQEQSPCSPPPPPPTIPPSEQLVLWQLSSMLSVVIQATTLPEELRKGKVLDYPLALMPGFFLSTSSPWLKGRYKLLLGTISWDSPIPCEGDWHCSPHAEPGSMAFISLSSSGNRKTWHAWGSASDRPLTTVWVVWLLSLNNHPIQICPLLFHAGAVGGH